MKGMLWDNCSDLFTAASCHCYTPAAVLSVTWNKGIEMGSLHREDSKSEKICIHWSMGISNNITSEVVKLYIHAEIGIYDLTTAC